MQITQREVRGVVILDLEGRLVLEDGVPPFVERMNTLSHRAGMRILLNFDKVTYLDSAGVGAVSVKCEYRPCSSMLAKNAESR